MKFLPLILCLLNFGTTSAFASFIDNTSYTSDTVSGLDWLDVTETVGLSATEVAAQFAIGGDYESWHYATGGELNTLIFNYTGSVTNGFEVTEQPGHRIDGLIGLLGSTEISTSDSGLSHVNLLEGQLGDFVSASPDCTVEPDGSLHCTVGVDLWVGTIAHYYLDPNDALLLPDPDLITIFTDRSQTHLFLLGQEESRPNTGSFLVRNTSSSSDPTPGVPEPSVMWLLGIGFFTVFSRSSLKI